MCGKNTTKKKCAARDANLVGFDQLRTAGVKGAYRDDRKRTAGERPQGVNATPHEKQARLACRRRCG